MSNHSTKLTAGDDFALSRQRHRAGDREVTDEEGDDADHERRGEEEDDGEKESQEQSEQYGEIPALARRPAMRRRRGRVAGGGIHSSRRLIRTANIGTLRATEKHGARKPRSLLRVGPSDSGGGDRRESLRPPRNRGFSGEAGRRSRPLAAEREREGGSDGTVEEDILVVGNGSELSQRIVLGFGRAL